MSIEGVHWAMRVRGISPAAKAVLFALGERHNKDTNLCCPDQVMLAEDCCMGERSARRVLGDLELLGFITRKIRSPRGLGRITHYTLHFGRITPLGIETNRPNLPVGEPFAENTNETSATHRPNRALRKPRSKKQKTSTIKHTHRPNQDSAQPVLNTTHRPNGVDPPANVGRYIRNPNKPEEKIDRSVVVDSSVTLSSHSAERDTSAPEFEALWQSWPTIGRRRSKGRSKCFEAFKRSTGKRSASEIVVAAKSFLKTIDPKFAPGLDRWLRDERFEHFVESKPRDLFADSPSDGHDWPKLLARWFETGTWPRNVGGTPDDPDYRGPEDSLRELIERYPPGHPTARSVLRNLETRKRA